MIQLHHRRFSSHLLYSPGEDATAVAGMTTGAAALHVCLIVRLDSVPFGTLFALPLLFSAVLSAIVLSDAHKVTERMAGVVMQTGLHRAHVNALEHLRSPPLRQCPRYLS
jgi:hypothetical protein